MIHRCVFPTLALLTCALMTGGAQGSDKNVPVERPAYRYTLADTFEVKGRQGVASDGKF